LPLVLFFFFFFNFGPHLPQLLSRLPLYVLVLSINQLFVFFYLLVGNYHFFLSKIQVISLSVLCLAPCPVFVWGLLGSLALDLLLGRVVFAFIERRLVDLVYYISLNRCQFHPSHDNKKIFASITIWHLHVQTVYTQMRTATCLKITVYWNMIVPLHICVSL
jgi:hypothetical protein